MQAQSRCGAYLVLNRGCNPQCIFAPYFHREDGTTRFVAIRDVFTVRNAVNILALLPVSDRFWAVDTLFFEAQARLQDLVYGYWSLLQPNQNPNCSFDLPTIPEDVSLPSFPDATLLPYPGEANSSQMPFPDDIDELGPVLFGNRRPN
ncbi:LOB domain-containing protein 29-like [Diospyros lotus]|uniref:LOB domain-containing protein 29-like n=1 Tax=Diospyros lotus TaxID=55363 RepID=UPI0022504783|nr:LOB domain-containing protein 29-like [Diospyros lotus]